MPEVDILIGADVRPAPLAVMLASLAFQTWNDFRIIVSGPPDDIADLHEHCRAAARVLAHHGNDVLWKTGLPPAESAAQLQFLLEQAEAPYCLFAEGDLILEPFVLGQMIVAIRAAPCGFIGSSPIHLSCAADVRPDEQEIEFWETTPQPELIRPESPAWLRHKLHNGANILHIQDRIKARVPESRLYRIAWIEGCVLYDTAKLRSVGGFLPETAPELRQCRPEAAAQLRLLAKHGGAGVVPSGVYRQEVSSGPPKTSRASTSAGGKPKAPERRQP